MGITLYINGSFVGEAEDPWLVPWVPPSQEDVSEEEEEEWEEEEEEEEEGDTFHHEALADLILGSTNKHVHVVIVAVPVVVAQAHGGRIAPSQNNTPVSISSSPCDNAWALGVCSYTANADATATAVKEVLR